MALARFRRRIPFHNGRIRYGHFLVRKFADRCCVRLGTINGTTAGAPCGGGGGVYNVKYDTSFAWNICVATTTGVWLGGQWLLWSGRGSRRKYRQLDDDDDDDDVAASRRRTVPVSRPQSGGNKRRRPSYLRNVPIRLGCFRFCTRYNNRIIKR